MTDTLRLLIAVSLVALATPAYAVAGEGSIARITIAISSLRRTSAYFGAIRDEAGVLAESSNDQLISRPPTDPDLAVVDLADSLRVVDETPVGKMMAARVLAGRLTFGFVPTIRIPSYVPPGESIEILRIDVPLRPGVEPGEYALSFESAEMAEISGRAISTPAIGGVLRVVPGPVFLRGDCNGDGNAVEVSDAHFLLNFNFVGGTTPICIAACDANGDGVVTGQTTDALYLLQFAFLGGPAPLDPFPGCGVSTRTTDLDLGCDEELPCP
jgi:hypothetical protein